MSLSSPKNNTARTYKSNKNKSKKNFNRNGSAIEQSYKQYKNNHLY